MRRLAVGFALGVIVAVLLLSGCVTQPRSHNEHGGYIEACGELPGLVGDDC
jgi:hypothetical protein